MPTDEPLPPAPASEPAGPGAPARDVAADALASDSLADRPATSRRARPDPLLGKVLDGRYRVLSLLARGGMGRVYRAEQAPLGRTVALKVLDVDGDDAQDEEFRQRFVREAEICARLNHPNTVRVFDYGKSAEDVLYIAMELLEGKNLFQAIQTDAPMDALRVIRIGRQIASSLREAHGLGLIHRDLKPSNIILVRPSDDEEFVKVVDFGLAKEIRADAELTRGDALVGSPSYMSPEQVRSGPLDERSDVYSLGILLYACLAGRPPFTGNTSLNVLMGHLNQPPPPFEQACPSMVRVPALEAVVLRCLAKSPEDRYPDMERVLQALGEVERELSGVFRPSPVVTRPRTEPPSLVGVELKLERRRPYGLFVGGLILATLAAGALWALTRGEPASDRADLPLGAGGQGPPATPPLVAPASSPPVDPVVSAAPGASAPPPAPAPTPAAAGTPAPTSAPTPPSRAAPTRAAPPSASPAATPPDRHAAPEDPPASTPPAGSDVRDPWAER